MRPSCVLVLLILLSGCLSNPTPHPATNTGVDETVNGKDATVGGDTNGLGADTGTPSDGPDGVGDAAPSDVDDAATDTQDVGPDAHDVADGETHEVTPDPPIDLHDLQVMHLDDDKYADIVLLNWALDDKDAWGLWIYDGANGQASFSQRDRIIKTRPRPDGVARLNLREVVDPERDYDLVVLGPKLKLKDEGGVEIDGGIVQVFEVVDRQVHTSYWLDTKAAGLYPDGGGPGNFQPIHIQQLPGVGGGPPRVLLADFNRLYLLTVPDWSEDGLHAGTLERINLTRPAAPSDTLLYLQQLVQLPGSSSLAVWQGNQNMSFFDTGTFSPETAVTVQAGVRHARAVRTDFGQDGKLEVAGYAGTTLSVVKVEAGAVLDFDYPNFTLADNSFDDVVVADLDGNGKLDIVLLDTEADRDDPAPDVASGLYVVVDAGFDLATGRITAPLGVPSTTFNGGFIPVRLAVGAFSDRGVEIWAFDSVGDAECMILQDRSELVRCGPTP